MAVSENDWREYTIPGREGDSIIVRKRGTLTIMQIDPAIVRQMPVLREKPPSFSTRVKNFFQSFTTLKD